MVEYKGARYADGIDSAEKRTIGELWERKSEGNGLFLMVEFDPLPDLPNLCRNGQIGLGTRYGEEKRFTLKLTACTLKCATYGTSINDFGSFGERSFT